MQTKILNEAGYDEALRGMAYSYKYRAEEPESWWQFQKLKATKRAGILCSRDGGHNKFLESIQVWIDIEACRAWWSEMDTYRAGVTKQSESTMHTLAKYPPTTSDFEPETPVQLMEAFIAFWYAWKEKGDPEITTLKCALPEGFLQRRVVCTNYKTLRNIIQQRRGHRLKYWDQFIEAVVKQVQHPELL
jgi:hypothetical protein